MTTRIPFAGPSVLDRRLLESAGGAVPLDSIFYIERTTDAAFRDAIIRRDSSVLIKAGRQMGKTSLLARGLQQARRTGAKVILTDFQKLNSANLASAATFYRALAQAVADWLELDVPPNDQWNPRLSPAMNFERYFLTEVLERTSSGIVWAMDEVDRLFTCSFGSEVFGLFRSWHNARALDPGGPWSRLTLAIAYATEAQLFITDINLSPFNVGTKLALDDFTCEQVAELNRRYGAPLKSREELERFYRYVGGQPFLVRRGLHELVARPSSLAQFADRMDQDDGIFGDHLRRILYLLTKNGTLLQIVRDVLSGKPCPNWESFYRLRSAGVMSGESASDVRPRCQLYANYFGRHLQ